MLKTSAFQHPDHRRAHLFRNGKNQAVRIPKEFEFPVQEMILRRKGQSLVIDPIAPPTQKHYAEIRLALEKDGRPIGPNDL